MKKHTWQLETPVEAVLFDCDGTLSAIEGIDQLAEENNVSSAVKELTAKAMGKTGLNPEIYEQRLALVKPSKKQVNALGEAYFNHRVQDVSDVIHLFQRLKKSIYILSAGLLPAVKNFAELLKIPEENIFAVNVEFDSHGNYFDFDRTSPLVNNDGKASIVSALQKKHSRMIYVGDGLNDLSASHLVTRFIGFGGVFYRKNILEKCQYYVTTPSLTSLLPLSLTENEFQQLMPNEKVFYELGLDAIKNNKIIIQE